MNNKTSGPKQDALEGRRVYEYVVTNLRGKGRSPSGSQKEKRSSKHDTVKKSKGTEYFRRKYRKKGKAGWVPISCLKNSPSFHKSTRL